MKWLKPILFASLFFNPIALLILFKSYWIAILIPFLIVIGGYYTAKLSQLRLTVWAFNIFAIIGIALNGELIFRQLYSSLDVPNIYEVRGSYYFNKPTLNQVFDDEEFHSQYRTNIQGYRIDLLSNPTDTIKQCDWLFIGDSFTQGAQVNYNEMFSTLIYREFPDKTIVNAGMSGAGIYESLNYLRDEGKKLKPKRVILQIGAFNDFYNIRERRAGWSEYLMEHSDLYRYIQYNLLDNPVLPLGRWTEPFFDNDEENSKYNIFYKKSSDEKEADKLAFAQVLKQFKKETDKIGAELVVMLIPSKEQTSEEYLAEVKKRFSITDAQLDMAAPNKLASKVCEEIGVPLIDLTQAFKSSETFPFFHRDEHLNSDGHKLIASEFSRAFTTERAIYTVHSNGNDNERYPTFYDEGNSVLCQSQDNDNSYIKTSNLSRTRTDNLWTSHRGLIHPMISNSGEWMVFTQGDQDRGETDVILFNRLHNKDIRINPTGFRGAIPMLSNDASKLAYPKWKDNEHPVIAVYDITAKREVLTIGDKKSECWRPIFSPDDSCIYYLRMDNSNRFVIRKYELTTGKDSEVLHMPFNIWDITISPNGQQMAFAGNKDGNWDLFVLDIATKKVRQLTHTIGNEWDPYFRSDNELWFAGEFGINNGIYSITIK